MPVSVLDSIVLLAAIGSGLIAGVFFAFSTFIMPALARQSHPSGIRLMQAINITVLTPWFLLVFVGTAILSAVAGLAVIVESDQAASGLRIAGALLYLLGTVGMTGTRNVPLNDALDAVDPDSEEGSSLWQRYLQIWTRWNTVRTIAAATACAAFIAALMSD